MFSNLNAEMGRAKLSIKSLSELTGINYETLKLKFRGVTEFKLCEMVEIKRKAFPDKTLDYLFATDETGSEKGEWRKSAISNNNNFNNIGSLQHLPNFLY